MDFFDFADKHAYHSLNLQYLLKELLAFSYPLLQAYFYSIQFLYPFEMFFVIEKVYLTMFVEHLALFFELVF